MYKIAQEKPKNLADLFQGTIGKMQKFNTAIVEKDFWVCLTLDYLFNQCKYKDSFTFKGGTSLSKAWGVIDRFSEDIDLILDWRTLGYGKDEPSENRSKNKQNKFNEEANEKAKDFIGTKLLETLRTDFKAILKQEHSFEVAEDGQTILFRYPRQFYSSGIVPEIRLEIGPLAAWTPSANADIKSYAAEAYPQLFKQPQTSVRTVTAERTFWEKATILHQMSNKPEGSELSPRYSRHFYDIFRLAQSTYKQSAFAQKHLLEKVAEFKQKFYPCGYAHYDKARIGSLQLTPPTHLLTALEKDYSNMREMIYGDIPDFSVILEGISALEKEINALS